ncbi:hypothetical protein GZH53_14600 [Flavihumibacter sp. R14]|nr:hypothetical protein [Flavihumibacter soli]
MRTQIKNYLFMASCMVIFLTACSKDSSVNTDSADIDPTAVAIASLSSVSGGSSSTDSVYVAGGCEKGFMKTELSESSLPASITAYLGETYSSYIFSKAFSITNSTTSVLDSYIVGIIFNSSPVGLKFNAAGEFVKVMELREGDELRGRHGKGHDRGIFRNEGRSMDTIALSALPAIVTSYFRTSYAADTLLHAANHRDSTIVVISKNIALYATVFASSGTFVNRMTLPAPKGKKEELALTVVPAVILTYLTNTYPAYVAEKAFIVKKEGITSGYLVYILANATKYAVQFDSAGQFLSVKTVR